MNYMLGQRSLWVFDFDGTLSSIVPNRAEAHLHRECERMLRFLARSPWNRVAVISSRMLDDMVARVAVPGVFLGGASGLEWMRDPSETWQAVVGVAAWVALAVFFRLSQRAVGSNDQPR